MKVRFFVGAFVLAVVSTGRSAPPPSFSKKIRVLQLNVFGRDQAKCEERMRTIARNVLTASPPYDLVAFNENWNPSIDPLNRTCDGDILPNLIAADPRYANTGDVVRSIRHLPRGDLYEASGGNTIFSLHPIRDAYENKFVNSGKIPISGYAQVKVELSPGVFVSYWTTHLEAASDGCDDECRLEQLTDLASLVSGWDANPSIVGGDFNIGGPGSIIERELHTLSPTVYPYSGHVGYDDIMREFENPIDVWLERNPVYVRGMTEVGYTLDCRTNSLQTACDYRERIDYLFVMRDRLTVRNAEFQAVPREASVVRWKTAAGGDVSDHYGLDATFEIRRR
jgi:hypothetical protein